MAELTGKLFYLKFGTQELNTWYRAFGETETGGVIDASAGADTARTYLTTLTDGSATATLVMQTGTVGTVMWKTVVTGTNATLLWGESSGSAGSPSHSVSAYVTERRKSAAYADLIVVDVSWQFTGAVTDSTI